MNSLVLAVISLGALALGYRFYGSKVSRWAGVADDRTTPAVELNDGVDYVPAKHWSVLFGHHFASIAGAAPILGPVLACMLWGWVPAILWIVLGGIFFGAVHDYVSLVTSVENKGRSVNDLSESVLGKSAKIVFSIFVLLALILVVAVFAAVAGVTLASTPQVVVPTFGLIFVAILVGVLVYKTDLPLAIDTAVGLLLLLGLIVAGYYFPVELPTAHAAKWWTVILLVYGMVAAVLPVSLLLQPRDHLAAGVLFIGMLCGILGILVTRPAVHSPAFVSFHSGAQGIMWPMLFVVIACGAISGFHSLVASGTTSKQLPRARDARAIGYGGMIMESALAVVAVIAVTAGLYWSKEQAPAGLEQYVYPDLMQGGNWIKTFGEGYGRLTAPLFGSLGFLIGVTMLKTFVMTTLDTATRITRYICSELVGDTFGMKVFKNRFVATLLIGVCAGALALGNWKAIWPVFGSSNQLIAGMVLLMATVYLLSRGRAWVFTAVPAALVFVTAMGALVYSLLSFLGFIEVKSLPRSNLLATVAIVLTALGLFIGMKGVGVMRLALRGKTVAVSHMPEAAGAADPPPKGPAC
jgi:carbon starvation protein